MHAVLPCDRPQSPQASFASDLAQLQSAARMWSPAVLGEVKELVQYAKDRGIRVIPEFDLPGVPAVLGPQCHGSQLHCCL